jgi:hypothetical protein
VLHSVLPNSGEYSISAAAITGVTGFELQPTALRAPDAPEPQRQACRLAVVQLDALPKLEGSNSALPVPAKSLGAAVRNLS